MVGQWRKKIQGFSFYKRDIVYYREDGQFDILVKEKESKLFKDLGDNVTVLLTHGDSVTSVPAGFVVSAVSSAGLTAAVENKAEKLYGVQFHPEVDLTVCGMELFRNFLFGIAECTPTFTISNREAVAVAEIQKIAGSTQVLCLVSGGVDSSVCAALLKKALPTEQIIALHIDNGFMRLEESKVYVNIFI